jgi:putrescine aminotransferase
MSDKKMRGPFEPLLAGCQTIPWGDLAALERALAKKTVAGFLVEPIQGEGGIRVSGWLREAQALCKKTGTLLLLDEVQTGIGRTGSLFAYQDEGFVPDVLVLGKALGGGIAPISVAITSADVHARAYGTMDRFDLHASTFGGNAFACVAGLETLAIVDDEKLVANARARGEQLVAGLRARLGGHPLVREIRGRGLLVGVELGPTDSGWLNKLAPSLVANVSKNVFGQWAALKLLERGILCQPASQSWNVLRLEPPLTIQPAEIDALVTALADVLGEYQGIAGLLTDVTGRVGRQYMAGWAFP